MPITDQTTGRRLGPFRIGAVLAIAAAAGLVAWLVLKGDNGSSPTRSVPAAASVQEVRNLAASVNHPIYWAGKKRGYTYELTRTRSGQIYIRYLPPDVQVGDPRPNFLTVGTYPYRNAYSLLKRSASRKDAITREIANGGVAVASKQRPTSVYFTYPGSDLQVEVYDPSASRALGLVSSGKVVPVR